MYLAKNGKPMIPSTGPNAWESACTAGWSITTAGTEPALRFGPVRCGDSDEKMIASPALAGTATASSTVSRHLASSPSSMTKTRCSTPGSTDTPTLSWVTMEARFTPGGTTSSKR